MHLRKSPNYANKSLNYFAVSDRLTAEFQYGSRISCRMLNPLTQLLLVPWFDHQQIFDLYKFSKLYINKHITNAKLHKFQQIVHRKKSKSAPKFRQSIKWTDFGTGLSIGKLTLLPNSSLMIGWLGQAS